MKRLFIIFIFILLLSGCSSVNNEMDCVGETPYYTQDLFQDYPLYLDILDNTYQRYNHEIQLQEVCYQHHVIANGKLYYFEPVSIYAKTDITVPLEDRIDIPIDSIEFTALEMYYKIK